MKKRTPCAYAEIAPDARGRITMREDKAYKCSFPLPEVVFPASISSSYGFRWPPLDQPNTWNSLCAGCPCWSPRDTPTKGQANDI